MDRVKLQDLHKAPAQGKATASNDRTVSPPRFTPPQDSHGANQLSGMLHRRAWVNEGAFPRDRS
jgi:hypothetical protein